jgi:hypothetical protein
MSVTLSFTDAEYNAISENAKEVDLGKTLL